MLADNSPTIPSPAGSSADAVQLSTSIAFGQMVTVLMRSPKYKFAFLAELEWLVAPAAALRQFVIAERGDPKTGFKTPIGFVTWATVSEAVDQRLEAGSGSGRLKPNEWASGSIPWLVDAVGEPRAVAKSLRQLIDTRFSKSGLKTFDVDRGGQRAVKWLTNDR